MKTRIIEVGVVTAMTILCLYAARENEDQGVVVLPPIEKFEVEEYVAPIIEPVEEVQEEVIEEAIEEVQLYDTSLDADIQEAVISICGDEFDAAIVIAMIEKESRCNSRSIGDGGDSKGLMQIQEKWHAERMKNLECDDLFDPIQNITVGIDYLKELSSMNDSIEWVLMAYNGGIKYANAKDNASTYAVEVLQRAEELKGEKNGN